MSLIEKLSLKLSQRHIRNMLKKGKKVDLVAMEKKRMGYF